jgi:TolA-binding protein
MLKAIFFVFGGTAFIYFMCFGSHYKFHFPSVNDVASQYEIQKIKKENSKLKIQLQKMEFTLARFEEEKQGKNAHRSVASVPVEKKGYLLVPAGSSIKDLVKQDVYHWSAGKLLALSEKEYNLKNHAAAAQYGMTLLNENEEFNLIDEHFYFRTGVSCIETGNYLNEGVLILNELVKKYPESPLIVQAKLWRGLAFHRLNNKEEFMAMMEEFKTKYRNTKEWTVLKSIYDRSIASGVSTEKPVEEKKQGGQHD